MEDQSILIKQETEALLEKLGLTTEVEVKIEEEDFKVYIDTPENALLIGKHGDTLSSLELILSLIMAKKTGEYKRILIEVGGYRKEREAYLTELTHRLCEEVKDSGSEKKISGLKSWERRLVHMMLVDDSDVMTESVGEGRDRVLLIKKK